MTKQSPEIIEVNSQQIQAMLERASDALTEDDAQLLRRIVDSYSYITDLVEDKNTSIARLRKLFFGSSSEKTDKVVDDTEGFSQSPSGDDLGDESCDSDADSDERSQRLPGHGRHGADNYSGGQLVEVPHPTLAAGDACPQCEHGSLYEKKPSVLVRFVGQAPLQATVYRMQKLRCHVCGKVFTAPAPQDVGDQKYDHTAASMSGLRILLKI